MKQFIAFVNKEFYHIVRDKKSIFLLLVIPIVLILIFGYAITMEIQGVHFAAVNTENSEESRRAIEQLSESEYFILHSMPESYKDAEILLRQGKIKMIVTKHSNQAFQITIDVSDPNEATQLSHYALSILNSSLAPNSFTNKQVLVPIVHLLYNPMLKGAHNFVPGVMGLIFLLICAMMTSISLVREKELGTMEVLLVSPIKPITLIIAKAIPYLLLSMVNIISILLISYFVLDVPIGNLWVVIFISILYSIVSLCLGLLISTVVSTQQEALIICNVSLMLPVMLMSGMIFPIENMPKIMQVFSDIIPAKWYIIALRDVMIKGLGIAAIIKEIAILFVMMLVLIIASLMRFKMRLQ